MGATAHDTQTQTTKIHTKKQWVKYDNITNNYHLEMSLIFNRYMNEYEVPPPQDDEKYQVEMYDISVEFSIFKIWNMNFIC